MLKNSIHKLLMMINQVNIFGIILLYDIYFFTCPYVFNIRFKKKKNAGGKSKQNNIVISYFVARW